MQPLDRLGKYQLQGVIGRGAAGIVYAGLDPMLARTVAIKVLPLDELNEYGREQYSRFKLEAQAVARMHHRHIVAVYDYGETDQHAYIVMENLEGGSLKTRLEQSNRPSLADVERIMGELLDGLGHSHRNGVVHRDIKPANIVFHGDGDLKITDFGIARLDGGGMTRDGSTLGTPAYMSPEQVRGETADARTDLYGAGVILFEMLCGRRPFEGSATSVMHKIVNAPPPRLADLPHATPRRFDAILATALAKAPEDRFGSAAAMWEALRTTFASPEPDHASADPAPAEPPPGAPASDVTLLSGLAGETTVFHRADPAPPASAAPAIGLPSDPAPPIAIARPLGPVGRPAVAPRSKLPWIAAAAAGALLAAAAWRLLAPAPVNDVARPSAPPAVAAPSVPEPAPPPPVAAPQPAPPPPAPVVAPSVPAPAPPPAPAESTAPADKLPEWRQAIAAILARAPCALLAGDISPHGEVVLTGITGLGDMAQLETAAALRRAIAQAVPLVAMRWNAEHADGPYCGVLAAMRPYVPDFGAPRPALATLDGGRLRLTLAATGARVILVDRFGPDGAVTHLLRAMTGLPADGSLVTGGQGGLLLTLVSSAPFPWPARPDREDAAAYVAALKAAAAQAQKDGAKLVAQVDGEPK